jgi:hypothetical protein
VELVVVGMQGVILQLLAMVETARQIQVGEVEVRQGLTLADQAVQVVQELSLLDGLPFLVLQNQAQEHQQLQR